MERQEKIDKYVAEACAIALDPKHGYSQENRNGKPDFDCSTLVIHCLGVAGIDAKGKGATYTGNMYGALEKCGFEVVDDEGEKGDIYLTPNSHVLIYIGDKTVAHAVADENGKAKGTKQGDQTGKEIRLEVVNNLDSYKYHLRLKGGATSKKGVVTNCHYLNMRKGANSTSEIVRVLSKGQVFDVVKEGKDWTQIDVFGKVGFINNAYWEVV